MFAVVSEPPPDSPDESCQDLCFAQWSLQDASSSSLEGSVRLPLLSSLEDSSDAIPVGWLEMDWSGLTLLRGISDQSI